MKWRAAYFLLGAGVGLDSKAAAGLAAGWIMEICNQAKLQVSPGADWIEQQLETMVHRQFFGDAQVLQQHLYSTFPPLPPGATAAARFRAAQRLTADFLFSRKTGPWLTFVAGDITSHGTAAAGFGALLHSWLGRFSGSPELDHLAGSLNREWLSIRRGTTSIAATLARWNVDTGALEVLNCGTPCPAVVARDGAATATPGGGWAIGWLPDPKFSVWRHVLRPGESLIVCSDGIIEQTDGTSTQFGLDRLLQTSSVLAQGDAEAVAGGILAAVDRHAGGGPPDDDQLVFVLQVR